MLDEFMSDGDWFRWVMTGALTIVVAFLGWMMSWCISVGRKMDRANERVGSKIEEVEKKFTGKLDDLSKSVHAVTVDTKLTAKSVESLSMMDREVNALESRLRTVELELASYKAKHP